MQHRASPHQFPRRYLYAAVFASLGFVLLLKAARFERPVQSIILGWFAFDLLAIAIAYVQHNPRVFGKTASGTLRILPAIAFLPFLTVTWSVWTLQNLLSREPIWSEAAPRLFVGRRCGARRLPPNTSTVIDFTAEFPTPREIRRTLNVACVPVLDGCAPTPEEFDRVLELLRSAGDTTAYVHCANGHGRSIAVVAALLVAQGVEGSPDAAFARLRQCRPRAAPNPDQRRFVEQVCQLRV